jgi:T5orf172 domain
MLVPDGVREELGLLLAMDQSLLGEAYRQQVDDPKVALAPYPTILLATILDGAVPAAATFRARAAARVWSLLELHELSVPANSYLTGLLEELERVAPDPVSESVIPDTASIYVYSLPSLLTTPAEPDGRTWLKVGYTSGDPRKRVATQGRQTGLPEDPVLLRVYQGEKVDMTTEQAFHKALVSFGHRRQNGQESGREWFLTDLAALDALASITGLVVVYKT